LKRIIPLLSLLSVSSVFHASMLPVPARAQQPLDIPVVTIASSPSPVGSGARAAGMGSAFIAIADDATAASWNPGGLVQLERPEISAVGAVFQRIEDFSDDPRARGDLSNSTTTASLNYLSFAYPFRLFSRHVVVSLNYQQLLDFNRNLGFRLSQDQRPFLEFSQELDFEQTGAVYALSPAFSVEITPRLSLGVAVNIWMDDLFSDRAWESHTIGTGRGSVGIGTPTDFTTLFRRDETFSGFLGVNVTLGMLWNVWRGLQIGAVVKTPVRADAHRKLSSSLEVYDPANPGNPPPGVTPSLPTSLEEEVEIEWPWSLGFGASYRFSDRWTLSTDLTRVEWADFTITQTDPATGERIETSPITGAPAAESDVEATYTVRLGTEYLFLLPEKHLAVPVRGGFFYDPLPSGNGTDDYFGFSLGSGVTLRRVSLDLAYTLRFGRDVLGDLLSGVADTRADVVTHRFLFSAIVYF
jgi:long-subunit fatty acid transport protein